MTKASVVLSLLLASIASAEDANDSVTESKAKAPAEATAPSRKDVDQEITNPKLRAETGSKRVLSIQSSFNYSGGSVSEPFGRERPRLSPGQVELDPTKITGSVSVKYRATDHDNINFGTGVGWLMPGHDGERGQMENPFVSYNRPFKAGIFQNVISAGATYYSAINSRRNFGLNYGASAGYTVLAPLFDTKWQLGTAFTYARDVYERRNTQTRPHYLAPSDTLAAFPFAEYWFNDRVHFRTVYRGMTFFNTNGRRDLFLRDDPTQSMGIGFVLTRDIYMYPNIQWVWDDMRGEKTNVALSANINL